MEAYQVLIFAFSSSVNHNSFIYDTNLPQAHRFGCASVGFGVCTKIHFCSLWIRKNTISTSSQMPLRSAQSIVRARFFA